MITLNEINEATEYLKKYVSAKPDAGIILGTGLGSLVDEIDIQHAIDYARIPHFPVSTVESHSGKLIVGKLSGKNILVMQGRFHYYEGYTMQQVTFPVRVMKQLGVDTLLVSNASGGVNRNFEVGDLMIITDHINLLPEHPLRGKNIEALGPRFPEMSQPYNFKLIEKAKIIAASKGIKIREGVYAATQGPTLETRAEYHMFTVLGADTVGMSTVPEVIVARHMNMRVFGISVITDLGFPESLKVVTLEDVIAAAKLAEPNMGMMFKELLKEL